MQFLQTRHKVYTTPPSSSDGARLDRLADLDQMEQAELGRAQGTPGPTSDEQKAEIRQEFEQQRQKLLDPPILLDETRFTLATCNTVEAGRRSMLLSKHKRAYEAQHGRPIEQAMADADPDTREAARAEWIQVRYWAAIMASLRKMETRQRPAYDGATAVESNEGSTRKRRASAGSEWRAADIPAAWHDFNQYAEQVPAIITQDLAVEAHAANPGLWLQQNDDEAKKNGGTSAG